MKKLKKQLVKYLESVPLARERRLKNRGITNLLLVNHPSIRAVHIEVLTEILGEILSLDRWWRLTLADRVDLRGKDYDKHGFKSKKQLEQEAQIGMDYESQALVKDFESKL